MNMMSISAGLRTLAARVGIALIYPATIRPRPTCTSIRQVKFLGMPMIVLENEDVGWTISTRRGFENREMNVLRRRVGQADVCVDVGANVGAYTLFFASRASRGRVISVEPGALPRAMLDVNVALNGFTNVDVLPFAVSSAEGTVAFFASSDSAFSSMKVTGRRPTTGQVEVPTQTIDGIMNGRRADVVKIDVEGAELAVLEGAQQTLADERTRPHTIMIEVNETNLSTYGRYPDEIRRVLGGLGYIPHSLMPDGSVRQGWQHAGCLEDAFFFAG